MSEFESDPLHRTIFYHAVGVKTLMQLDPGVARETRLPLATLLDAFGVRIRSLALPVLTRVALFCFV
jgi:hypothetical protein